jgi:hypothetical protein
LITVLAVEIVELGPDPSVSPFGAQQLQDLQGRRLARIVRISLVGGAEHEDLRALEG